MYFYTTGVVFLVLLAKGSSVGLISWNMNLFCGTGYSKNVTDYAGEVYFDVDYFNGREDNCNLTITPATWGDNGGNMVMFYFTTFEFRSACDLINVSVIDGIGRSADIVQGLPRFLCGLNSSLTGRVFSTSAGSLQIQVHVNLKRHNWNMYGGQFRLKFITYHTGSCFDSFSYRCSNGHCIPYLYNCSDNINACGDASDNCNTEETTEEVSAFGKIIKYFFIFVACVCIIWLLKAIGKETKQKCRNAQNSAGNCCHNMRLACVNCCKRINLSRFPKPRLPKFIRNRLKSRRHESADDNSTADAIDNTGFSDEESLSDESEVDPVQVVEVQIRNTNEITQTDIEPPSYDEVVTSSTHSFPYNVQRGVESEVDQVEVGVVQTRNTYELTQPDIDPPSYNDVVSSSTHSFPYNMQPEEPPPIYGEVMSEYPMSSAYQVSESSSNVLDLRTDNNVDTSLNVANDTVPPNSTSDVILEPDTSSILNLYIHDFAIDLSDDYSTDSDWDLQGDSSSLPAEQISATQSIQNENDTRFMISSCDIQRTVSSSDWDSDSNSSQVQSTNTRALNNTSNMSHTDWDSESNSSVLSQDQERVPENLDNTEAVLSTNSHWDSESNSSVLSQDQERVPENLDNTEAVLSTNSDWDSESNSSVLSQDQERVPENLDNTEAVLSTNSDWDSESNSSILSQEAISMSQSAHSEGVSACDLQNEIDFYDQQDTENVTQTAHSGSDVMNAPSSTGTQRMTRGFDEQQEMPERPPTYDEAVPPPYYYDYIASVGRYKQNSFENSEA